MSADADAGAPVIDAERSVLGALLLESERMSEVAEVVGAEEFKEHRHRLIFDAMASLWERNTPIDPVSVGEVLRTRGQFEEVGGNEYLLELLGSIRSTAHATYHARMIARAATLDRIRREALSISQLADGGATHDDDAVIDSLGRLEMAAQAVRDALVRSGGATEGGDAAPASGLAGTWPAPLSPAAFHGLAGDFVRTIEPLTEADPAALLVQFLVVAGSAMGASAHAVADGSDHGPRLFAVVVGQSAKARKGTSWRYVERVLELAEPAWTRRCKVTGLSSGEGLIASVRDDSPPSTAAPVAAVSDAEEARDKRRLAYESEFGAVLARMSRDGNTLSSVLKAAWDGGELSVLTRSDPLKAKGAHVSVVAHVTLPELLQRLDGVESVNGFGNRFLWVCARRSKELPDGGRVDAVAEAALAERLRLALVHAHATGELLRDEAAQARWRELYHDLSTAGVGLAGDLTSRAEAQVVRLSLIYALLDRADRVCLEHLEAALAVWRYCVDSARSAFGERTGDVLADRIREELRRAPRGLDRESIRRVVGNRYSRSRVESALSLLAAAGAAERVAVARNPSGGRPREVWRTCRSGGNGGNSSTSIPSVLSTGNDAENADSSASPRAMPSPNPVAEAR